MNLASLAETMDGIAVTGAPWRLSAGLGSAVLCRAMKATASHTAGLLPRRSEVGKGEYAPVDARMGMVGAARGGEAWTAAASSARASHIALGDERKSEVRKSQDGLGAECNGWHAPVSRCMVGKALASHIAPVFGRDSEARNGNPWRADAMRELESSGPASHTAERNLRSSEAAAVHASERNVIFSLALDRTGLASHTAALRRGSSEVGQFKLEMAPAAIGWQRHSEESTGSTHSGSNRAVEVGPAENWRCSATNGGANTGTQGRGNTTTRKRVAAL